MDIDSMTLDDVVKHCETIKDPDHLNAVIKEALALANSYKKEARFFRNAVDEQEARKQQKFSDDIIKNHRLKRTAVGFGREKNKLRDRERAKKDRQRTFQTNGLTDNEVSFKKSNLPEEIVEHLIKDDELLEVCQTAGLEVNEGDTVECDQIAKFFEESSEITVTERTYTKTVHKRAKYNVENTTTGEKKIITAPGPAKLYPKCQYSIDFALQVVVDKFLNHLPYDRQRKDLRRAGFNTPVSTYCRLERGVCANLEEIAEQIRVDILTTTHLAAGLDETRWPLLQRSQKNGYFWILCNQAGSYYRFEQTRSGDVAKELLGDYKGSVVSDKFSGYLQFLKRDDINWGLCLAHARRDFISLQDHYPRECSEILELMDEVFALEHKPKSWGELAKIRKEKSLPLMKDLKELLEKRLKEFFPKDEMSKAIMYVLSNWKQFVAFTDDVKLPVSNNESERALRQSVMGRKSYHGSKTIDAADQAATLFTVIETCKKANLDPRQYIKYVIENNHKGIKPLTPLKLALKNDGKSKFWPESQQI